MTGINFCRHGQKDRHDPNRKSECYVANWQNSRYVRYRYRWKDRCFCVLGFERKVLDEMVVHFFRSRGVSFLAQHSSTHNSLLCSCVGLSILTSSARGDPTLSIRVVLMVRKRKVLILSSISVLILNRRSVQTVCRRSALIFSARSILTMDASLSMNTFKLLKVRIIQAQL